MRRSLLSPLALAVALVLISSASALELSRTLPAADITQPPNEVRFLIYDGPDVAVPIEIADFGPGQYWLEEQGAQIEISAELLQDLDPEGLWIETELDGQTKGERVVLRAVTPGITFASGNHLNMDGNTITNLEMPMAPVDGLDAVNRAYVESADTTGNAATATQLVADGADCASGHYPLGVDEFGSAEGCTTDATDDTVSSTELDTLCSTNNKILKRSAGSWACADDAVGTGDNLGNHIATQNIQLGSHWLSSDGGNEGIQVDASGKVTVAKSLELAATTDSSTGVIFKGGSRFLHNYQVSGTEGGNLFIGVGAGNFTLEGDFSQASRNTGIGEYTLTSNTTGYQNTAVGSVALYSNTSGYRNTAVGRRVLSDNTSGSENTAMGFHALYSNTAGYYNVGIGAYAGLFNEEGSRNTFIGFRAGQGELSQNKSGNVFIGYEAGFNELGNEKLYIENSNSSTPLIGGDFSSDEIYLNGDVGIGTMSPAYKLDIEGNIFVHGVDGFNSAEKMQ